MREIIKPVYLLPILATSQEPKNLAIMLGNIALGIIGVLDTRDDERKVLIFQAPDLGTPASLDRIYREVRDHLSILSKLLDVAEMLNTQITYLDEDRKRTCIERRDLGREYKLTIVEDGSIQPAKPGERWTYRNGNGHYYKAVR